MTKFPPVPNYAAVESEAEIWGYVDVGVPNCPAGPNCVCCFRCYTSSMTKERSCNGRGVELSVSLLRAIMIGPIKPRNN